MFYCKWLLFFLGISLGVHAADAGDALDCKTFSAPRAIKMINDWDIIADNTASIPTAFAFSGKQLIFAIHGKPKNNKNVLMLNTTTGVVTVKAIAKDDFDVTIIAKNACGSASLKFNIWIDEEE